MSETMRSSGSHAARGVSRSCGRRALFLLLPLLTAALIVWLAPASAQGGLVVDRQELDFGRTALLRQSEPLSVLLTNQTGGDTNVELDIAELSDEFRIVRNEPPPDQRSPRVFLQRNESWRLDLVFKPTSSGEKRGRLLFKWLDTTSSQLAVVLKGTGTTERGPSLQFSPSYLEFDPRLVNSPSDKKTVILENKGDGLLRIRRISLQGAHAGDFARGDTAEAKDLAPGDQYTIDIRFTPKALGSRSATLSFQDGSSNLTFLVGLAGEGRGPQRYRLWDLDLPSGGVSDARAISSSGQMVGGVRLGAGRYHAASWTQRGTDELPNALAGGSSFSAAEEISPDGRYVVGWVKVDGGPGQRAFFWDRQRGRVAILNTLGGSDSIAYGVNNRGEVVGTADTEQDRTRHAFVWRDKDDDGLADPGEMDDLGALDDPGNHSTAYDINADGVIVGRSQSGSNGEYRAVVWSAADVRAPEPLQGLGGRSSEAFAIQDPNANDGSKLMIVGRADTPGNASHACLWEGVLAAPTDLGTPGETVSEAYGINRDGWVVGRSQTVSGEFHAFLYHERTRFDLNSLIPAQAGWVLNEAWDINDRAEIVGIGTYRGQRRAFRLGIPSLMLDPKPPLTFGSVPVGKSSSRSITLANRGTAPLHIDPPSIVDDTDGEYRLLSGDGGGDVDPAESAVLIVEFRPKRNGVRGARLKITSSDPDSPHTLSLAGTGVGGGSPNLQVSPLKLDFGSVEVASASKPQSITLTNVGTAPLLIQSVALSGSHPGDFSLDRVIANTNLQPRGTGTTGTISLNLTFTPKATGGRSASLVITHAAPGSPMILPVTGTGTGPALRNYAITDLGTLGGTESRAYGINNRGQVVGWSKLSGDDETRAAFIWDATSGMRRIPTLGGAKNGALQINDSGQVVGWSYLSVDDPDRWHAILWDSRTGRLTDLGHLGGGHSEAWGINNRGQVVGWSSTQDPARHAFLWTNGVMQDLGTLGHPGSWALDISDAGLVVGYLETAERHADGYPIEHAFLWDPIGKMRDLHTAGPRISGRFSTAWAINDDGHVVGGMGVPEAGMDWHAFLWYPAGGLLDLHSLDVGQKFSFGIAINKGDEVIGYAEGDRAFVWNKGVMALLQTRVTNCDCWSTLNTARSINDSGQIVGWGVLQSGERHAFLLTPVPP